ncbi:hypothetical protein Tco_0521957 [Tanacetum coccineum]
MSTQQDIYAAGSENRPLMLNKENYVPWSSRLLRYAKSRPNGKLIYNSIMNGPYVRRMIPEPGDTDREVPVPATFHEQTDDEPHSSRNLNNKQMINAIQDHSSGLPEDIYARCLSCLMNGKENQPFPEKIASNLKFLNNLQPEWSRHVTIVHQTKDLHTTDYTQLYDFLKYNQKEVDDQRAERLAKTHDPLALMANSNNPFNYPVFHQDQPSPSTYMQQPQPINNNHNPQPSFNQNFMHQPIPNPEDITDPTTAMNMALALMAKAFKLNYFNATINTQENFNNLTDADVGAKCGNSLDSMLGRTLVSKPGIMPSTEWVGIRLFKMQFRIRVFRDKVYNTAEMGHLARKCTVRPRRRDAAYLQTQLLIAQKEEAGIQLQAEEFDLMAAAADLDEIEEIPDGDQLRRGTVDQHPATVEETHAYFESLYNNLALEVEKVNSVNRKMKETNADLTTELARYKSQEKYDKLERCYQKSVYQEQCLTKKINALHLSSGKQITTLNEEISNLSKQLSTEKSTVSSLLEEKKKLKSDFKIREDES